MNLKNLSLVFKNIDLLLHKLDKMNEQNISLNQRKLEALCGFYSHKDIPFFIKQVLTYLETPIQKKQLKSKEIIEKISTKKEETNNSMSSSTVSFPPTSSIPAWNTNMNTENLNTENSNNIFNTTHSENSNNNGTIHYSTPPSNQTFKFSFPPTTTSNMQNTGFPFNNGSNISNTSNQNNINNFSFPSSNNTLNQTNSSSLHNFSQQQPTFTLPSQSIQNIIRESSIDTSKKDSDQLKNQGTFTLINKYQHEHQEHPFIKISCCSQDIINNEESNFLCHIAQDQKSNKYLFISRQLLNKQENKIYEYLLPENYSWISTYNCFEETIFHVPLMHLFLTVNNEHNHKIFENIHNLLCAFEDLLKNILLPMLKHKELSEYVHPKIKESITFPVLIAFDNEFKESQYSFKNLLIKEKPKDLDIQWLKEGIQFNKDILRNYQLVSESELETWIYNSEFKKSEYLYYIQFD